jgi:lipocalin-like protein
VETKASEGNSMLRRSVLLSILLCPCTFVPLSHAKQPLTANDSSRFIGTWDLVSVEARWPDGHITAPWGANPPGRLIYSKDGRMSALLMHEFRNQATRNEVAAALQNEAAGYFGTYTVDSARHIVSHHVEATLRSVESGTIDRSYEFKSGNLYLIAKATRDKLPVTYVLVWRRATIRMP